MTRAEPWIILASALVITTVLFHVHDQFWWAPDEGVYAYVAQQMNRGVVLHRDMIDLHAGLGNLINAAAFRLFGEDLLSLRYPLVLMTVLQSALTYALLRPLGAGLAAVAALAVTVFAFPQFPNPSANWHALVFVFCLWAALQWLPRPSPGRLVVAGLIVGLCFVTRQLSGVFLGLGLVAVLLSEARDNTDGTRLPGLLVAGICGAGLLAYLISKNDAFAFVWAGLAPLCLYALLASQARMTWSYTARVASLVLLGFALGVLPMVLHTAAQGALFAWANDLLFAALSINNQDFIGQASVLNILVLGLASLTTDPSPVALLSLLAWTLLLASVPLLGLATLAASRQGHTILPLLAVFGAVGALHYQIPVYFYFILPPVLAAWVALRPGRTVAALLVALSLWSLAVQVGQPLTRGLAGIASGERAAPNVASTLPRVTLHIPEAENAIYTELLAAIDATPDEPLFALPLDPQLYFMTGRRPPVPFYQTALALRTETDVKDAAKAVLNAGPMFVVHRRVDKYNDPLTLDLLSRIQAAADAPRRIGPFDLYRLPASTDQQ